MSGSNEAPEPPKSKKDKEAYVDKVIKAVARDNDEHAAFKAVSKNHKVQLADYMQELGKLYARLGKDVPSYTPKADNYLNGMEDDIKTAFKAHKNLPEKTKKEILDALAKAKKSYLDLEVDLPTYGNDMGRTSIRLMYAATKYMTDAYAQNKKPSKEKSDKDKGISSEPSGSSHYISVEELMQEKLPIPNLVASKTSGIKF